MGTVELRQGMHVHMIGIGGFGLSAIARILLGLGYRVSGSDQVESALTDALSAEGATVMIGHASEQVAGADVVLVSSAIPADNPELLAARRAAIPVVKRAEFIGELMVGRKGIAIAGTHGKTTTTAMVARVATAAGLDPTFVVGGVLKELGTNARAGLGDLFVIEADEYDRMFLGLRPQAAVLTVVEHDHPDVFPTLQDVVEAFRSFIQLLPDNGVLVVCADDPGARDLGREWELTGGAVRWYGMDEAATWRATNVQINQAGGSDFVVSRGEATIGLVRLRIPGRHNILNALAAITVADWADVPFNVTRQALAEFGGVERRFEIKGEAMGVVVVDDYAHHPTEVTVTLAAARDRYPGRRIWAVFQPHTYSRTKAMIDEFATSFGTADEVVVMDVYGAREADDQRIGAPDLVARMSHPRARHIGDRRYAAAFLADHVRSGDVLLTMGAGDGYMVGEWVLDVLRNEQAAERVGDGG